MEENLFHYYIDHSAVYRGKPKPIMRVGHLNGTWGHWALWEGKWESIVQNRYIPPESISPTININIEVLDKEYVELLLVFD